MSLKTTALIAAICNLVSAALGGAQFVRYLSMPGRQSDVITLVSWPIGILATLTLALFLLHLVGRKKHS